MEKRQLNSFDFIRFFAASSVVIAHTVEHLNKSFLWFNGGNGLWFYDGVPLFFILSGMLVYRSYEKCALEKKSVWVFFKNRFLRVAPAIYAYAIVVSIMLVLFNVISLKTIIGKQFIAWFVSNITLTPVYSPSIVKHFGVGVLNGSLWTIPCEVGFYIFVPFIYLAVKKFGFKKTICALFFIGVVGYWAMIKFGYNIDETIIEKIYKVTFVPYLTYFATGILFLKVWDGLPKSKILFILSIIVYIIIAFDVFNIVSTNSIVILLRLIPLGYIAMWFGYFSPNVFKIFSSKIGDLSYGIYIWHIVVINSFMYFSVSDKLEILPDTIIIFSVYLITLLIAFASWNLVEKRCLKLKSFTSNVNTQYEINKNEIAQ